MSYIETYTGKKFYPLAPRLNDISIIDIAHALSHLCRFAGHCERFYSVAEHSVHVSRLVAPENALWGLLHDATEAYLCDIPRPIKPFLKEYKAFEDHLMEMIAMKFKLPSDIMPMDVKNIDSGIIHDERLFLMRDTDNVWESVKDIEPAGAIIYAWQPMEAKAMFLERFLEITHG